jgi:hypothetical protein
MTIDFEKDQQDAMKKTDNIQSLADQVETSVSFGRNEDNKAADYAELAKSNGFQPTQKMKVEPMTLKALVRERIEAGKEMPTEIFGVYSENKTTIKRSK